MGDGASGAAAGLKEKKQIGCKNERVCQCATFMLFLGFLGSFHYLTLVGTRTPSEYYLAQNVKNTFVYTAFEDRKSVV